MGYGFLLPREKKGSTRKKKIKEGGGPNEGEIVSPGATETRPKGEANGRACHRIPAEIGRPPGRRPTHARACARQKREGGKEIRPQRRSPIGRDLTRACVLQHRSAAATSPCPFSLLFFFLPHIVFWLWREACSCRFPCQTRGETFVVDAPPRDDYVVVLWKKKATRVFSLPMPVGPSCAGKSVRGEKRMSLDGFVCDEKNIQESKVSSPRSGDPDSMGATTARNRGILRH